MPTPCAKLLDNQIFHIKSHNKRIPIIKTVKQTLKYSHYTDIRDTNSDELGKADMCTLCGKPISGVGVAAKINGREYLFDRQECAVTFMKLKSVYGDEFCVNTASC
ncbi:MAG: hypothetical protein ACRD5H_16375 [Nitrososphaerales archaeon]